MREAAAAMQGELQGTDWVFTGVSSDSRQVQAGQLFFALQGPHFDGHDFAPQVQAKGAAGMVVTHAVDVDLPQIIVSDTRLALGQLAAVWRARFQGPVIAVTGSNGKTTVKEMLAAILLQAGKVHATRGNLNNEIGVPLTLLDLSLDDGAAVIEEGASHPGDIAYLTQIVRPTVAVVTNASGAHLEGFGSLEAVARTKGEIYEYLAKDGVAVINADDPKAGLWLELAGRQRVSSFGLQNSSDVRGLWQENEPLTIVTPQGEIRVRLHLEGRHNAMNALAATAAALAAGASLDDIKRGLESMLPVAGRLQWKQGMCGVRILDDTYNANPASLAAALDVLAACEGERYLALGDMAELGAQAHAYHQQAGTRARECGVQQLYAVGENTKYAVSAFGERGHHFAAQDALIAQLKHDLHENVVLLVKGSRSAHMEKVVAAVTAVAEEGVA
jgi:UDP-N-acetylmuramoyl-tripeptide--D-alanyl-D-alanine ligase